ncbi:MULTISPECIES: winged helix-turn-helix domain-containing protein [Halomonadaceae]|uniref:LysR family transcriptional regulator n=2 Tax=Vreelandella TaxID=3137766 RepID=A0A7Z0LQL3_9GAMM|nr:MULTISPECIES: winged helix-turn-helix domain-containing protein [Halomonas]NYS76834.1 LysR family transcriptional regulator [Halomonas glaciei]|tara:strand:+ start:3077 stop:3451 length:375 start_codon:yes stop_codon:yes gene_type:complete
MTRTHHFQPTFQLRLALHRDVIIGPGKADLLEMVEQTGSISAGGRALKMSYKKAWQLIDTMNNHFLSPLVSTSSGGNERGGAHLTELGKQVLAHYRALETQLSQQSVDAQALLSLLAPLNSTEQ